MAFKSLTPAMVVETRMESRIHWACRRNVSDTTDGPYCRSASSAAAKSASASILALFQVSTGTSSALAHRRANSEATKVMTFSLLSLGGFLRRFLIHPDWSASSSQSADTGSRFGPEGLNTIHQALGFSKWTATRTQHPCRMSVAPQAERSSSPGRRAQALASGSTAPETNSVVYTVIWDILH